MRFVVSFACTLLVLVALTWAHGVWPFGGRLPDLPFLVGLVAYLFGYAEALMRQHFDRADGS